MMMLLIMMMMMLPMTSKQRNIEMNECKDIQHNANRQPVSQPS